MKTPLKTTLLAVSLAIMCDSHAQTEITPSANPEQLRSDANPDATGTPIPEPEWTQFHGYVRYSFATSRKHSPACYKLAGAVTKYRFGNECDDDASLEIVQKLYHADDGMNLTGVVQGEYNGRGNRVPGFGSPGTPGTMRMPQSYLQLSNIPNLPGARAFIGRIKYRQVDIHTIDYSYWDPAGLGAGIENLQIGQNLKFSYALFIKDSIAQSHYAPRHDLQLSGMYTNPRGELSLGLSFIPQRGNIQMPDGAYQPTHAGWTATMQHIQTELLGGKHKFALQFGKGPGSGLIGTGALTQSADFKAWRVINALDWQLTRNFSGMVDAVCQRNIAPGASQTWVSFGARPVYALTRHLKAVLDFGHDRVKPDNGATRTLNKVTTAIVVGKDRGFWSRPELRFFYTHAHWNKATQDAAALGDALSDTGVFSTARTGSTVGVQFETWF
jgi:maltoporin